LCVLFTIVAGWFSGSIVEYKSMNLKIGTKNIPVMVYFKPFVLKKKKKKADT
jgi:hypothetical protein